MSEKTYKPQMPDLMEAVFDAAYLIFDLIAGILFFTLSNGNPLFILYGILTFILCGGDAFHLVPRIFKAVRGSSEKIKRQMGIGLQISSITMTVFYILLMYVWKYATFHSQKCGLCSHRYRRNYFIRDFWKCKWLSQDKDGCSNYYFFRMLSAGNIVQ